MHAGLDSLILEGWEAKARKEMNLQRRQKNGKAGGTKVIPYGSLGCATAHYWRDLAGRGFWHPKLILISLTSLSGHIFFSSRLAVFLVRAARNSCLHSLEFGAHAVAHV